MIQRLDDALNVFWMLLVGAMVAAFFGAVLVGLVNDPLSVTYGAAILIAPPLVVALLASPYYLGKCLLKRFR